MTKIPLTILPRISTLSFAMMPMASGRDIWFYATAVLTILPLAIYIIASFPASRKKESNFITTLFGYRPNLYDIGIIAFGVFNCLYFGWEKMAMFWIVLIALTCLEKLFSRRSPCKPE